LLFCKILNIRKHLDLTKFWCDDKNRRHVCILSVGVKEMNVVEVQNILLLRGRGVEGQGKVSRNGNWNWFVRRLASNLINKRQQSKFSLFQWLLSFNRPWNILLP